MYILGISSFYHDSSTCLIKDGKILNAVEEERFSRVKHDNKFPFKAVEFCLKDAGISIADVNYVAYYEKPLLKFERILQTFVETYPFSLPPFTKSIPEWINRKIKVEHIIRKELGFKRKVFFIPHHLSHAAAAYYTSPYKKAAILTVDGAGEYQTTGLWKGEGNSISGLEKIDFPSSLGLLYSTFTSFLGFRVNNDEYKVMGLAAYGKPVYKEEIYKTIDVKEDGSFALDMKYFSFRESFQMWNRRFEKLFGEPRKLGTKLTKRDKNLAASVQEVTEEIYFKMLNHLFELTKTRNLCVSGGVGLNSLANGKIYDNTPFKKVSIFGPAGDGGTSIGAALFVYRCILKKKPRKKVSNVLLGSEYSNEQIKEAIQKNGLKFTYYKKEEDLIKKTVNLLDNNEIIGWYQGQMEFGPRALGSRSILAKPAPRNMKTEVNKIKRREQFRPFAGSVLQEKTHEYFEVPGRNHFSPFMNFVFQTKEDKKDKISAIVHKDGTCRIQTVNKENGRYYRLIKEFYKKTGTPCLLNTSFNIKGEPIVENPKQAIQDFLRTKIDYLVIGDYLVYKG